MTDLGPLLAAVTDEWERGLVIAERAGIDSRTLGQRMLRLIREGLVEKSWTDKYGGVTLYRRGPNAPPVVTPADIVARARDPLAALIAFVGQELDHAGFAVRRPAVAPPNELAIDTAAGTIYLSAGMPDL